MATVALVPIGVLVVLGVYAANGEKGRGPMTSSGNDPDGRIEAFWKWWPTAADRFAAAIDAKTPDAIATELTAHVVAIDPRLAWETGPGLRGARHHLAISPEGDPDLRILTEKWKDRAPAGGRIWEYYPARQAFPRSGDWSFEFTGVAGVKLDHPSARVEFDTNMEREVVDVTFHHPEFAALDERHRRQATFLILDTVLGEDGVERWIGGVKTSVEPPPGGKPLAELAASVDALRSVATGQRFAILKLETRTGQPTFASVNLAIKRLDHLAMDQALTVTIPLQEPTPQGLTTNSEANALNALEDDLLAALGHDAVYLGRETGQGQRRIYFHVARAGSAKGRARAWVAQHGDRPMRVAVQDDARWEILRRW